MVTAYSSPTNDAIDTIPNLSEFMSRFKERVGLLLKFGTVDLTAPESYRVLADLMEFAELGDDYAFEMAQKLVWRLGWVLR